MVKLSSLVYPWQPIVSLERLVSRNVLFFLRLLFGSLFVVFTILSFLAYYTDFLQYELLWTGIALVFFGLWLEQIMLYCFHNYHYFAGLNSLVSKNEVTPSPVTYDLAKITLKNPIDLTYALLTNEIGLKVCMRVGIKKDDVDSFLLQGRERVSAEEIIISENDGTSSVYQLSIQLIQKDVDLKNFIESHGITTSVWLGAIRWVVNERINFKLKERWWSSDNLLKSKSLGSSWSFGYTSNLNRFSKPILTSSIYSRFVSTPAYAMQKVEELSYSLIKEKAGNALIVGEAGVGKTDIVVALDTQIKNNMSIAGLQHRRIIVLDTERFVAVSETAPQLEKYIISVFDEALRSGNCILVIENMSHFIASVLSRNVSLPELLDPYLAHPDLLFIATDTPGNFHQFLQPQGALLRRFSQIILDVPDTESVVNILQRASVQSEVAHNVSFTYPALIAIAQAANRYVTDGVLPDSALTLLVEVATNCKNTSEHVWITPEVVSQFLKNKTGIPMGQITEEERDMLMHLEDVLHERVIGQSSAIDAIANTMRRARVGIQSSTRPIGSFLFLGSTGVGKTETAKTLSEVFFGDKENMVRFDMSEYSSPDSLHSFIGDTERSGSLGSVLHDHPYTVLLLDEFEKAHQTIHDLFLQILDEGAFTDGRGHRVNARNTIVIATSNAGSELIYKTKYERESNRALDQRVIDYIIDQKIFRPELINRFDNTIIFEPLRLDEQKQIADLMLRDLRSRIEEKGFKLEVGEDIKDYLIEHGYSEKFGAREMRRQIQDIIESAIADRIIMDNLHPGSTIKLSAQDIKNIS